jgi:hypothetical protein
MDVTTHNSNFAIFRAATKHFLEFACEYVEDLKVNCDLLLLDPIIYYHSKSVLLLVQLSAYPICGAT